MPNKTSTAEQNAAYQRAIEHIEQRVQREETLSYASAAMHRCGASQHTIATALRGLQLFLETTGQTSLTLDPSQDMQAVFALLSSEEPAGTPGLLLSDVPSLPVEWLWPQRIPLGTLTLLEGCPGTGASLLSLFLAAAVSSGLPFPDGPRCPQGHVLLISPHDDASTTIKPRLLAAGGDPSQVVCLSSSERFDPRNSQIIDRPFSLAADLDRLQEAIVRYEPLLVIIDALDTLSPRQRTPILLALSSLARSFGCAIVLLRAARQPSAAFSSGQLAAGGAPRDLLHLIRSALRIVPASDDNDMPQFLLTCTKHSLDIGPADLAFEITSDYLSPEAAALASPPVSADEPAFFADLCVPVLLWREDLATSGLHRSIPLSRLRQVLLQTLQASPRPLSPKAIAALTGEGYAAIRQTLRRMRDDGELLSPSRGLYTVPNQTPPTTPPDPAVTASQPSPSSPPTSSHDPAVTASQPSPLSPSPEPTAPPDDPAVTASQPSPLSPPDPAPVVPSPAFSPPTLHMHFPSPRPTNNNIVPSISDDPPFSGLSSTD